MAARGLNDVIKAVESRLPKLVDQIVTEVTEKLSIYRGEQYVNQKELRRSIHENLRYLIGVLRDPALTADLSVPQATGRRRAQQGAPLPEVLQVYRITFTALWSALAERVQQGGGEAVSELLIASTLMWKVADEHAAALTEGYRSATAELIVAQEHRRTALVEILLTGHVGRDGGPWEAAALLGFPPGNEMAVIAAQTRGIAEEGLPGAEKAFARQGMPSGWRLTPSLQLGIVSFRAEQLDAMMDVLRGCAMSRVGVSPSYEDPADSARALRLARAALAQAAGGSNEVRMLSASPVAALVAADPSEGRRLRRAVLGPVLDLAGEDRATLLATLDGYLTSGGSTSAAAETLHCHPNTVRYRLRRIEDLTGRSFDDPSDIAELAAAALAARGEGEL